MKILKKSGRDVEAQVTDSEIDGLIRQYVGRRLGVVKSLDLENGLVIVRAEIPEAPPATPPRTNRCWHGECAEEFQEIAALETHCRTVHGLCGTNVSGYGPCERPLGHEGGHHFAMFGSDEYFR